MTNNNELDLAWVNSIKGLSILGVFLVHTYTQLPIIANFSPFEAVAINGRLGAHIFYLLNAFLLCVSYYKDNTKTKWGFLIRKLLRLIPLVWLVSFLKYVLIGGYSNTPAVIASLFFMDVLNPKWWGYLHNGWISVLAFLNFLFIFIIDRINTLKKSLVFSVIAWYGSIIGWRLLGRTHNESIVNWGGYILLGVRNFAFGILLYYVLVNYQKLLKQKSKDVANVLLAIGGMYIISHIIFDNTIYFENIYGEFSLAVMIIILSLVISKNRVLINPIFDFLGKYSYGIFLLHLTLPRCFPMLEISNPYFNVLVLLCVSVIGAYVFSHVVEKPLLRYIDEKILKRTTNRVL